MKIYQNSNLTGFQRFCEKVSSPTKHSLTGWAIRKIDFYQKDGFLRMTVGKARLLSLMLAVAMPIFALLDVLATPFKAIWFAARTNGQGVKKELLNGIKHLALLFFAIPAAFVSVAKPRSVYHSLENWKNKRAEKFVEEASRKEKQLRAADQLLTKETVSRALQETLTTLVVSPKVKHKLGEVIQKIEEELSNPKLEINAVAEHFFTWFAHLLADCHAVNLDLNSVDSTFFSSLNALVKLRMPGLREELTRMIVRDYAKGASAIATFKQQLAKFSEERQAKVDEFLRNANKKGPVTEEDMQNRYPHYTDQHFSYLPLYLALKYVDNPTEIPALWGFLKNIAFKNAQQARHLFKFFILLNKVKRPIALKALSTLVALVNEEGKKLDGTIRTLKHGNVLLRLDPDKFYSMISSPEGVQKLNSTTFMASLFSEKFDLSSIKKYPGEKGSQALAEDVEQTFGKFRDPLAVMTLYTTLATLPGRFKNRAMASLNKFVRYVLAGGDVLKQKRHAKSKHLQEIYKKYPHVKEAWENSPFISVCELDPSLAQSPMKDYTIGEANDPCDLLLQTTEVKRSCMHLAGRARKTRGLLGALLDGKIHSVIIKNEQGKIVCRMLLRFLDCPAKGQLPFVIDDIFTSATSQQKSAVYCTLIEAYYKRRAQEMQVDVVSMVSKGRSKYGSVISHGGVGAYEHLNTEEGRLTQYPDAVTEGKYTIKNTYLVFSPNRE